MAGVTLVPAGLDEAAGAGLAGVAGATPEVWVEAATAAAGLSPVGAGRRAKKTSAALPASETNSRIARKGFVGVN
jgi:hypothetical protein